MQPLSPKRSIATLAARTDRTTTSFRIIVEQ
jgi:hypothetical protein